MGVSDLKSRYRSIPFATYVTHKVFILSCYANRTSIRTVRLAVIILHLRIVPEVQKGFDEQAGSVNRLGSSPLGKSVNNSAVNFQNWAYRIRKRRVASQAKYGGESPIKPCLGLCHVLILDS